MAVLQITGDSPGSGKTSLTGALLLLLAQEGKSGAYYKPLSPAGEEDQDVAFFSEDPIADAGSSRGLAEPPPAAVVAGSSGELDAPLLADVASQVDRLRGLADSVLLEGPDLTGGSGGTPPLALQLASATASRAVLVFKYTKDLTPDAVSDACHPFGDGLAGVVVNGVTAYRADRWEADLAPPLLARGLPYLGAVPEDRSMLGVSAAQIADFLRGRWVQEPENPEALVERFLIGGNILDAGPTHFGREPHQAVVTSAARPDIQMASLSSGVSCLVLTGGAEPAEYARAEAVQRGVPMIVVEANTMDTAEALGGLLDWSSGGSRRKIRRFLELLQRSVDVEALVSAAG